MESRSRHQNSEAPILDVRSALGALRRRKWTIIGSMLVGCVLALLVGLLITPKYTATSSILIRPQGMPTLDGSESVVPSFETVEAYVENQVQILRSRSNLERVILDLGLQDDPGFDPSPGLFRLGDLVGGGAPLADVDLPATDRDPGAGGVRDSFFRDFAEAVRVARREQSAEISVSFTASDPERAAEIANAIVSAYLDRREREKDQTLERAAESLEAQIERLRQMVLEAERAVEDYRAANHLWQAQDTELSSQQLAAMRMALNAARVDRVEKEERVRYIYQLRTREQGYKPLAEVAASPILVGLLQREDELKREEATLAASLGAEHPQLQRIRSEKERLAARIDEEIRNIIRNLWGETSVARARENELAAALDEAESKAAAAGMAGVQLRVLERDAASKRTIYEAALARYVGLQERGELQPAGAEVISVAVPPEKREFPKLSTIMAIGLIASAMVGTALAAIREHLDNGVRTARQIEETLGVSALGLVPRVKGTRAHPHQYLLERPNSAYAEAVKSIFVHAHLSRPNPPPRVVLVTSTVPREGKTTLAVSLAASIARSGQKTIIVDLDLRHPSIARELGRRVDVGLVEYLTGQRRLEDIIQQDGRERNLHILPTKVAAGSPTDLLGSPMMRSLIAELRQRYDYVVLDTPPTLGFSDVEIVTQLADAVLFVVQWERTSEDLALHGIEALRKSGAPVVGAAVTQVDLRKQARYDYYDISKYYNKYPEYFKN